MNRIKTVRFRLRNLEIDGRYKLLEPLAFRFRTGFDNRTADIIERLADSPMAARAFFVSACDLRLQGSKLRAHRCFQCRVHIIESTRGYYNRFIRLTIKIAPPLACAERAIRGDLGLFALQGFHGALLCVNWDSMNSEGLKFFFEDRVAVKVGDITKEAVDAIVNAANSSLLGGGGVDGAIHRAGGPEILKECKEIRRTQYPGGLPTGQAVITTAGKMVAKHVIHTVGPVYGRGGTDKAGLLAACYRNSLMLAIEKKLRTIAFPAISTGIYGYPQDEAANVSSSEIQNILSHDKTIEEVRLIFFSPSNADSFLQNQVFTK